MMRSLYGLIQIGTIWYAIIGVDSGWFWLIWVYSSWFGLIQVHMGWFRLIRIILYWFWLIWVDTGWYGLIWVDSGRFGLILVDKRSTKSKKITKSFRSTHQILRIRDDKIASHLKIMRHTMGAKDLLIKQISMNHPETPWHWYGWFPVTSLNRFFNGPTYYLTG